MKATATSHQHRLPLEKSVSSKVECRDNLVFLRGIPAAHLGVHQTDYRFNLLPQGRLMGHQVRTVLRAGPAERNPARSRRPSRPAGPDRSRAMNLATFGSLANIRGATRGVPPPTGLRGGNVSPKLRTLFPQRGTKAR